MSVPIIAEPDQFFVGSSRDFRVPDKAINGHMVYGARVWRRYRSHLYSCMRELTRRGIAEIEQHHGIKHTIQPDRICPDGVFAADPLLAFIKENGEKIALVSRMKYPVRQREVRHARIAAHGAGFKIVESDCLREGSGDTLFDPNYGVWFTGVGQRTAPGAGKQLSEISARPVIEIPTLSDEFYHIDTFMSFLPKGHVVLYRKAMTAEAYNIICAMYPPEKRLEVDTSAAMKFVTNLQIFTDKWTNGTHEYTTVLPADTPRSLQNVLRRWGYKTRFINIKAARMAGGGIHCCFQRVWNLREHPQRNLPTEALNALYQATEVPGPHKSQVWGIDGFKNHPHRPHHGRFIQPRLKRPSLIRRLAA